MSDGAGQHRRASSDVVLALDRARTEPFGADVPTEGESERTEAFVVRMALTAQGWPLRATVTHVRSLTEHISAGWAPGEVVRFMEACVWSAPRLPPTAGPRSAAPGTDDGGDGPQMVDQDVRR